MSAKANDPDNTGTYTDFKSNKYVLTVNQDFSLTYTNIVDGTTEIRGMAATFCTVAGEPQEFVGTEEMHNGKQVFQRVFLKNPSSTAGKSFSFYTAWQQAKTSALEVCTKGDGTYAQNTMMIYDRILEAYRLNNPSW